MSDLPCLHTARTVMQLLAPERAMLLQACRIENRDHLAPREPARVPAYFDEDGARLQLEESLAHARAGTGRHFVALGRGSGRVVATCAFTNIVRGVFQACHLGFSVAAS
jgi:ribosomal-protein-alanine N-acetyltransferase